MSLDIRDRIVEFTRIKASELTPHPQNWHKHPKAQQDAMSGILKEVGYVDAIMVREHEGGYQIIDGHLRAETTPDATVPVLVVDLDDAETALVLATFDPLAAMAEASAEHLDALLQQINTTDAGLQAMLADVANSAGLYAEKHEQDAEPKLDEADELNKTWQVKAGDIWLIGKHRIMCGDSTNADDVARLMDGEKAASVLTDPPYGIGSLMHGGTWAKKQESQLAMMRKWDDTTSQQFFDMVVAMDVPAIVWGGNYFATPASRCWLVWDKPDFPTMSSAELAWTNMDQNSKRIECARTHQSDGAKQHATQKPVRVMSWSLGFVPDGLVYDPFLGSGTTLIAAQQLNRKCYGMEISPAYCAVILQRAADAFPEMTITRE